MPDNNIPLLNSPFLSNDSLIALEIDTKNRFNLVHNSGGSDPIPYPMPSVSSGSSFNASQSKLLDNTYSKGSLYSALNSPDRNIRNKAADIFRYKTTINNPATYNIGVPKVTKYDPAMDKYIHGKFGYNPDLGIAGNEEIYYRDYLSQNIFSRGLTNVGVFLGRLGTGILAKTVATFGYMGSMIGNGVQEMIDPTGNNAMADIANNSLSRWAEVNWEENWKNSAALSVFKPSDWEQKGFFSKLFNPAFWTDEVADGAAFMGEMILSTYLTGGIGKLAGLSKLGATGINTASKLSKLPGYAGRAGAAIGKGIDWGLKFGTGADDVAGIGRWMFLTSSESAVESSQKYRTEKEELYRRRDAGDPKYVNKTDFEIENEAGNAAAATFRGNMAILAASNAFENRFIFNKIFKGKRPNDDGMAQFGSATPSGIAMEGLEKGAAKASRITDLGKASMKEFKYSTKLGQYFNWKSGLGKAQFYGKLAGRAFAVEGLWEENAQLAVERLASEEYFRKMGFPSQFGAIVTRSGSQIVDAFTGKDLDAQTAIGLGALIGIGGGGVVTKVFGGEKLFRGERRQIVEDTKKAIQTYELMRGRMFSFLDMWKKDENGKYIKENGELVIDPAAAEAILTSLYTNLDFQSKIDEIEMPSIRQHLMDKMMQDFVWAAKKAGIFDRSLESISRIKDYSPEEAEQLGFDPNSMLDHSQVIENLEKVGKRYDEVFNNPRNKTYTNKQDIIDDEHRKYFSFKRKSTIDSLERTLGQLISEEDDFITKNLTFDENGQRSRSDIIELNSLRLRLYSLEQLQEQKLNFLTSDYAKNTTKFVEDEIQRIKEKIDKIYGLYEQDIKDGKLVDITLMMNDTDSFKTKDGKDVKILYTSEVHPDEIIRDIRENLYLKIVMKVGELKNALTLENYHGRLIDPANDKNLENYKSFKKYMEEEGKMINLTMLEERIADTKSRIKELEDKENLTDEEKKQLEEYKIMLKQLEDLYKKSEQDYQKQQSSQTQPPGEQPTEQTEETEVKIQEVEDEYLIAYKDLNYKVFKEEPTLFYLELPDNTTQAVENKDVPDIVKTELNKFIKEKSRKEEEEKKRKENEEAENKKIDSVIETLKAIDLAAEEEELNEKTILDITNKLRKINDFELATTRIIEFLDSLTPELRSKLSEYLSSSLLDPSFENIQDDILTLYDYVEENTIKEEKTEEDLKEQEDEQLEEEQEEITEKNLLDELNDLETQNTKTRDVSTDAKVDIEKEKSVITDSEFKELTRLAKFFLENPKEPTVAGSVVTRYPALFKAVTDIERRRELSLKAIEEGAKIGSEEATYFGPNYDPSDVTSIVENITTIYGKTKQELIDKINAKYDAELATLGTTDAKANSLKRGDIIKFQLEEYQVERVTENSIDVRNLKTGDADVISKEDYNAELEALEGKPTADAKTAIDIANKNVGATRRAYSNEVFKQLGLPTGGEGSALSSWKGVDFTTAEFKASKVYQDNKDKIDGYLQKDGINSVDQTDGFQVIPTFYDGVPKVQVAALYNGVLNSMGSIEVNVSDIAYQLGKQSTEATNKYKGVLEGSVKPSEEQTVPGERFGDFIVRQKEDGRWGIFDLKGESLGLNYGTKEEAIAEIAKSQEEKRREESVIDPLLDANIRELKNATEQERNEILEKIAREVNQVVSINGILQFSPGDMAISDNIRNKYHPEIINIANRKFPQYKKIAEDYTQSIIDNVNKDPISDQVWEQFTNSSSVDLDTLNNIAKKYRENPSSLSERERTIFNAKKAEIESIIEQLTKQGEQPGVVPIDNTDADYQNQENFVNRHSDENKSDGLFTFVGLGPQEVLMDKNNKPIIENNVVQTKAAGTDEEAKKHRRYRNVLDKYSDDTQALHFKSEVDGKRQFRLQLILANKNNESWFIQTSKKPFLLAVIVNQDGKIINFDEQGNIVDTGGVPLAFEFSTAEYSSKTDKAEIPNILLNRESVLLGKKTIIPSNTKGGNPVFEELWAKRKEEAIKNNQPINFDPLQDIVTSLLQGNQIYANIDDVLNSKLSSSRINNSYSIQGDETFENTAKTLGELIELGFLDENSYPFIASASLKYYEDQIGQSIKVGAPYFPAPNSTLKIPLFGKKIKDLTLNGERIFQTEDGKQKYAFGIVIDYIQQRRFIVADPSSTDTVYKIDIEEFRQKQGEISPETFQSMFDYLRSLFYSKDIEFIMEYDENGSATTMVVRDKRPIRENFSEYRINMNDVVFETRLEKFIFKDERFNKPESSEPISYSYLSFVKENFVSNSLPANVGGKVNFVKLNRRVIFTLENSYAEIEAKLKNTTAVINQTPQEADPQTEEIIKSASEGKETFPSTNDDNIDDTNFEC